MGDAVVVVSPVSAPSLLTSSMTLPEMTRLLMRVTRFRVVVPATPLRSLMVPGCETFS